MTLTKNHNFLLFILQNRGASTITEIIKLSYLIDLASLKDLKNKISNYEYKRYFYWPYTKDIQDNLEDLALEEFIKVDTITNAQWYENILYIYSWKKIELKDISNTEQEFILQVLKDLAPYRASSLTRIAYKTEPLIKLWATLWW